MDHSSPGCSVHGILQARTLEWVAVSFSNAWKWKVKLKSLSCVWLFATPWTVACQAALSMGFSRQEYWSGLPFFPAGIFPTQGLNSNHFGVFCFVLLIYLFMSWYNCFLIIGAFVVFLKYYALVFSIGEGYAYNFNFNTSSDEASQSTGIC